MDRSDTPTGATAFLSYRSSDTGDVAARLASDLKRDLGLAGVYHAPTDNAPMEDWVEALRDRLHRAQLLIALVGPKWVGCPGVDGPHARCLHRPDDWVRQEVTTALADPETDVLPVLVDVPGVPSDGLPEDVQVLARRQGVALSRSEPWDGAYQAILVACWMAFERGPDRVLVVADDTDEAQVAVDELVARIAREDLVAASELSSMVANPRGTATISLRQGSERWPDVVVVRPRRPSEHFRARIAAVTTSPHVREVGLLGGAAGAIGGIALWEAALEGLTESTLPGTGSAAARPGEMVRSRPAESASVEAGGPGDGGGGLQGWWQRAGAPVKAAVVAPVVVAAGVGAAIALDQGGGGDATIAAPVPYTLAYGPLEVDVHGVDVVTKVPDLEPTDEPWLLVDATVRNDAESGSWSLRPDPFRLLLDGRDLGAANVVEGDVPPLLDPREVVDVVLGWAVPEGVAYDRLELQVAEPGRVPASRPEPVGIEVYPLGLDLAGAGPAQGDATGCRQQLEVTALGAEAALDLPDDVGSTGYGSPRANLGERLLRTDLRLLNLGGESCGGGASNVSNDDFRLVVDGQPREPVSSTIETVGQDATLEVSPWFAVPVDADEVVLEVGGRSATVLELPLDVSEIRPVPEES